MSGETIDQELDEAFAQRERARSELDEAQETIHSRLERVLLTELQDPLPEYRITGYSLDALHQIAQRADVRYTRSDIVSTLNRLCERKIVRPNYAHNWETVAQAHRVAQYMRSLD